MPDDYVTVARVEEIPPGTRCLVAVGRHGVLLVNLDGTLYAVGSTYSPESNAIYDGLARSGVRPAR